MTLSICFFIDQASNATLIFVQYVKKGADKGNLSLQDMNKALLLGLFHSSQCEMEAQRLLSQVSFMDADNIQMDMSWLSLVHFAVYSLQELPN